MLSYSRGPDAPLIDASIWEVFEKTASRFPDREALVVRHQGVRLTFSGAGRDRGANGAGLGGIGNRRAGSGRRVVDELRRVGSDCTWHARGLGRC